MNHTPAPWDFVAEPGEPLLVYSGTNDEVVVAEVNAMYDNDRETLANARLIAAAPELLEALQALASADFGPAEWTESAERAALMARAAISKATGG